MLRSAKVAAAEEQDNDGTTTGRNAVEEAWWTTAFAPVADTPAAEQTIGIAQEPAEYESQSQYSSKAALEAARFHPQTGGMDVALIDSEWLMQQNGPPPCRQQLPDDAYFRGSVDAEDVEVLVISHPWLSRDHPDPEGWNLGVATHFLRLFFTLKSKGKVDDGTFSGKSVTIPPAGEGKRVAIFWSWLSLFQEHNPGGCTEEQEDSFHRALMNIDLWYASSETLVWRLTKLPPAPRLGHDVKRAALRGWSFMELAMSEMISPSDRVLDLGLAIDDDSTCRGEPGFFDPFSGLGGWLAAEEDLRGQYHPTVIKTCSRHRHFPLPPEQFNEALNSRNFSDAEDADFVKGLYEKAFQGAVVSASSLNFCNASFDCPISDLGPILGMCKDRLRILDLGRNKKLVGTLDVLSICENLESLSLRKCTEVAGGSMSRRKFESNLIDWSRRYAGAAIKTHPTERD